MAELFSNLTIRLAGVDETPIEQDIVRKSAFFRAAFQLHLDRVVVQLDPRCKKDSSLGVLWQHVKPAAGMLSFELATVLPYYLPTVGKKAEYVVTVDGSYAHYGYMGLALVQVSIACESVLAMKYERFLQSRGVSGKKYKEAERDITYSHLLNLHLATVAKLDKLPDRENLIGRLNWARNCRNDMVHRGQLEQPVAKSEVAKAIQAAKDLVAFLREVPT